jgi:hypothetical protein
MAAIPGWFNSRAFRLGAAVLMVLFGLFELIIRHTATHRALGLMWLVVGIAWGIRCQFTPRDTPRESRIGVALFWLLMGASSIAGGTGPLHIEVGLMYLVFGITWIFRGLQPEQASLTLLPPLLPPDEPSGSTPSSGSEPGPGRGISAQ